MLTYIAQKLLSIWEKDIHSTFFVYTGDRKAIHSISLKFTVDKNRPLAPRSEPLGQTPKVLNLGMVVIYI